MKNWTTFIFLICIQNFAIAIGSEEEINKISKYYNSKESISMLMVYTVYENHQSTLPLEQDTASYIKQNDSYYFELLGMTSVIGRNFSLILHEEEKIMIINYKFTKDTLANMLSTISNANNQMFSSRIEIINTKTKCIHTVYNQNNLSPYSKVDVYYNSLTYAVNQIDLYYREKTTIDDVDDEPKYITPHIQIKYLNPKPKQRITNKIFDETTYFIRKEGKTIPSRNYNKYRIIENK